MVDEEFEADVELEEEAFALVLRLLDEGESANCSPLKLRFLRIEDMLIVEAGQRGEGQEAQCREDLDKVIAGRVSIVADGMGALESQSVRLPVVVVVAAMLSWNPESTGRRVVRLLGRTTTSGRVCR